MFRRKTPEQIAADEAARLELEQRRRTELLQREQRERHAAFLKTPAGQAHVAKAAGARLFQIALPLSKTHANVVAMVGAFTTSADTEHASVLGSIEAQGWRLEHAGYVFRVTSTESRDKFLSSGQQEAVSGEIIGIYVFRVDE